ncbi:MAG: TauD/TfdA family dioxygenase [Proteobacteria bacterium]|nr:TauD/TfdA family dioxygenase [Pseudomonadota bacterium]
MALEIKKLADHVGVEVKGVDASKPFDEETLKTVYKAWVDHSVLVLKGQNLTPQQFVEFGRQFGKPIEQNLKHLNVDGCPELAFISSEDRDIHGTGKRIVRGTSWHTDHAYAEIPPKATMLYGIDIPAEGGDTQFTSAAAAFDALPAEKRNRLDGLRSVHSFESSRSPRPMVKRTEQEIAAYPGDAVHPLIRTNPDTGRKSLYVNTVRSECILDMEEEESNTTLDQIYVHLNQEKFHYRHKWTPGDIVVWDNRSVLHKANGDYEGKRFLYRIMVEGNKPT